MKKKSKIKWIAIPLALILVLALSVMGFSALMAPQNPKVMLDGNAGDFVITGTDSKASNGNYDLFPDLKNLMPGDSVTQKITVGVKNFSALDLKNVTIFMKADNPRGDYNLLKDSRYVTVTVKHGSETVSGNLGEEISLGLFNSNGTTDLTMTVTIDKAAGNELQGKLGSIDWTFYTKTGPVLNKKDHLAYIIGYPDNTVRPERQITRAEVATIYFRLLTDESRNEYKSKTNN
ncbi:MAG: S-layer homology domain-containing protein, partial [Clostridia bacterium]